MTEILRKHATEIKNCKINQMTEILRKHATEIKNC